MGKLGGVRLCGARIGSLFDCSGATITNPSGPPLNAESLQVGTSVFLGSGFYAAGTGELGAVRLVEARIGGRLNCCGGVVVSRSNPQHHWQLDG